jgi:hypothetical protein
MKTRKNNTNTRNNNKEIIFTHYTKTKFGKFKRPKTLGFSPKPFECLWFGCNNVWEDFVMYEMDETSKEHLKYKYIGKLDLSNVLILKTKEDIINFSKKYAIKMNKTLIKSYLKENYDEMFETYWIDWNKVRDETKSFGIFIPNANIEELRYKIGWYSTVDVCSVAIWDERAIISLKEEKKSKTFKQLMKNIFKF